LVVVLVGGRARDGDRVDGAASIFSIAVSKGERNGALADKDAADSGIVSG
jgi:hypothetical protein